MALRMGGPAADRVGAVLLGDIEEASLNEFLSSFRNQIATADASPSDVSPAATTSNAKQPAFASKEYPLPGLDELVARHSRATSSAALELTGRHLYLLYDLIATLLAPPQNKAVVLVDIDGRFDVTRLLECRLPNSAEEQRLLEQPAEATATAEVSLSSRAGGTTAAEPRSKVGIPRQDQKIMPPSLTATPAHTRDEDHRQQPRALRPADLKHLHIYRCATTSSRSHISSVVNAAEEHMLYGQHGSRSRSWWGTIVIGGGQAAGFTPTTRSDAPGDGGGGRGRGEEAVVDVTAAWNGWLRVERAAVPGFGVGVSVEAALADRERRQGAFERRGWVGRSVWGEIEFGGDEGLRNRLGRRE